MIEQPIENRKEREAKKDDDYTGKYTTHPLARFWVCKPEGAWLASSKVGLKQEREARKIFTTRVINPLPKPKETTTKWTLGPQFKQQGLQLE